MDEQNGVPPGHKPAVSGVAVVLVLLGALVVIGVVAKIATSQPETQNAPPQVDPRVENEKEIASVKSTIDTLPLWTTEQIRALSLAAKPEDSLDENDCDELREAKSLKADDEFARLDQQKALATARSRCRERLAAQAPPLPKLARIQIPVEPAGEFDFAQNHYMFDLTRTVTFVDYSWVIDYGGKTFLVLNDADHDVFIGKNPAHFLLAESDVERARTLKARVGRADERRMVEVVFRPVAPGPTGVTKENSFGMPFEIRGPMGRAVAFRVLDQEGELLGWTGFNASRLRNGEMNAASR